MACFQESFRANDKIMNSRFVISLGGSVAFPEEIDFAFLRRFCFLLKKEVKKGKQFIIIVGGGRTARKFQEAAEKIVKVSVEDKDWLGIYATWLNARLLMAILGRVCHSVLLSQPGKVKDFGKHAVIVGAGWRPGASTDLMTVRAAVIFRIPTVINLGKPAYVYTSNPDKYKNAKPLRKLTWNEYFKIIPKKWTPGLQAPFDPVASRLAQKSGIKVIVAEGKNLKNFRNILQGRKFQGTSIE